MNYIMTVPASASIDNPTFSRYSNKTDVSHNSVNINTGFQ